MPRLRYRKDWNYDENLRSESSDETDAEQTNKSEDVGGPDDDAVSGQSWLSNAAIVASIPDAKLRSALVYHRTMSKLFEQELRIRGLTGRGAIPIHRDGMFGDEAEVRGVRRRRSAAQPTATKATRKSLTPQQMLAALDAMTKLKKGS